MHLRRYRSDIFTDKYKRLAWDEVSRSITAHIAKDGYWYIHPQQHRTLSVREAARVQTFPDWFRFAGQPSLRLKQIGNAVPPLLGEALGRQMRAALEATAAAPSDATHGGLPDAAARVARAPSTRLPVAGDGNIALAGPRGGAVPRTHARRLVPVIYERLRELAPSPARCFSRASTR